MGYSQGNGNFPPKSPEDFGYPAKIGFFGGGVKSRGRLIGYKAYKPFLSFPRTDKWVY
jgi:hypothetical protein